MLKNINTAKKCRNYLITKLIIYRNKESKNANNFMIYLNIYLINKNIVIGRSLIMQIIMNIKIII